MKAGPKNGVMYRFGTLYQWMEHEFPSEEEHSEWEEWLQSEAE